MARAASASASLYVEFTDTGIGIDPEFRDRIFEPFYQGEAHVRRRPDGLGLGLSIGRSIAGAHGGRLSLEHTGAGIGSTFRLELGTVARRDHSLEPNSPPSKPAGRTGLNVLLVEDNHGHAARSRVSPSEAELQCCAGGSALGRAAAARESQFDLLISDIELPDGTGLELIHGLGGGRVFPGIAISGFGSEEDLQQAAPVPDLPNT